MGRVGRKQEPLLPDKAGPMPAVEQCLPGTDDELQWFRSCLQWMFMDQSDRSHAIISWVLFFLLGIVVPAVSHFVLSFRPERRPYGGVVQVSLSAASGCSFLCFSTVLRRYGLRRFLFLDKLRHESERVRLGYTHQLTRSFRILSFFVFPCFFAETAYKIWWYSASADKVPWLGNPIVSDIVACFAELASWLYRTSIFLLTCVLFRLICYLQNLRLQDFVAVFDEQIVVEAVLKEHLDIRKQLKIVSHRFRGFIVACFLIVTASQFSSVLLTTRKDSADSLFNTGELAMCSIMLVFGLLMIFRGAVKITHQAQALTSHAAKWHACATMEETDTTDSSKVAPTTNPNSVYPVSFSDESSEADSTGDSDDEVLEDTKFITIHANNISFQKRQALVTYLENNRAGITVFGFMLDRSYLHTVFMLEWTLFLWLLGKTIGF
ncbi:hypothetical protein FCM35_KLT04845 [Carex littledalei]|uniref:Extracellular ligand-gated ion channel n=1 Tax=Carex littledalei TaxID=544730 RepID=A0A833QTS7_9POAL|nr:hypothetical protein FCM35_KLT04845 [Carex littledalei]